MIDIKQLLVILVVVIVIFGTKRLRNVGSDLGAAIKGFRKSMNEAETDNTLPDSSKETATANPEKATSDEKTH